VETVRGAGYRLTAKPLVQAQPSDLAGQTS